MGSDDLFRKRKAKKQQDHRRKAAKREPYDRVLIVCEGEKTEPLYFNGLRDHYRLNTANVAITGKSGSAPSSILETAKKLADTAKKEGNPFDKVYCVFDKDQHTDYQTTVATIRQMRHITAITSAPCFEYWILLHFINTTNPYSPTANKTAAELVRAELKKYYPNYKKNNKNIFQDLLDKLDTASKQAKKNRAIMKSSGTDNPSTLVDILVDYLRELT